MGKDKKNIWYIGGLVVFFTAVFITLATKNFKEISTKTATSTEDSSATSTIEEVPAFDLSAVPTGELSENPPDQKDVVNQTAYLIDAYTRHEKNYIGVDYVIIFNGEEAIAAQIEDKVCVDATQCSVPEGGYVRNVNPHYRVYEISTTTPLTINASTAIAKILAEKGLQSSSVSFEDLKGVIGTMPKISSSTFPYKDAKSLVLIDIRGGGITRIHELEN